ncbi:MAG TPA: 3-phosphoshikimate 1-carboxyvinyltransferase [Acidimicrobiales bacterium]|nr:MAG: 3-phosphoshikimate 1-carboxyvinyltransferase [Actinobacteria bacterium 21-73-9]HQU25688.1 3-phosphoshikimate 1-carboxyvinyltransferase [Acidimicrobiales bacterium]
MTDVAALARVRGSVRVPGDKSYSHRAVLLSALAEGSSTLTGLSPGADVAATLGAVARLGATVEPDEDRVRVSGPTRGLRASAEPLECANSGTTMRLLCGVVAGIAGSHRLVGDASLSRRPMDRVAAPLRLMGARLSGEGPTLHPPLLVEGGPLAGVEYHVPVPSAQVKSAVLFAGLGAAGSTTVVEAVRTRTTTEDTMREAGLALGVAEEGTGRRVTLAPGRPAARGWFVPGDPSQAAFFAVLGAIHEDASLEVVSLDAAPERVGFVAVLARMGGRVTLHDHGSFHSLSALSSTLAATEVHSREIPSVDEVPILTVAACAAEGVSAFREMAELRVKESDRFAGSMELARRLGATAWAEGDDFFVEGLGAARRFAPFALDAALDHRMVMAAAIAGAAGRGCSITGAATVETSYPHFLRDLALLA